MENNSLLEFNKKEPDKKGKQNERSNSVQSGSDDVNSTSITMDSSKNEPVCNSSNSMILEQLPSDNDSIENDCSYEEIELTSAPRHGVNEQSLPIRMINKASEMQTNSDQNSDDNNEEFIKCIIYGILESSNFDDVDDATFPSKSSNSFDLFDKVSLSDSLIENHLKLNIVNENSNQNIKLSSDTAIKELLIKVKQLEEVVIVKEAALNALTSELESLKEIQSNNSSTLNSGTSTTEYKCIQEELQSKIVNFQNALVYRDSIIQQLTESLQQSVNRKEELQRESQLFLQEINLLKRQLLETSNLYSENENKGNLVECETQTEEHDGVTKIDYDAIAVWTDNDLPDLLVKLESQLNPSQMNLFSDIKMKLYESMEKNLSKMNNEENFMLQDDISDKNGQELKIVQFNELAVDSENSEFCRLRLELENKHTKEMEELRTYFEQKCVDLEKHYSEEVLISRKLSGSSYCSGNDFNSDVFLSNNEIGPGGDTFDLTTNIEKYNYTDLTKSDIQKLKEDLQEICTKIDAVDLINATNSELHVLLQNITTYDLKVLTRINLAEIQNRNQVELEILREDYENRINFLGVEYNKKMQDLEKKHYEEISALKYEFQRNVHYQQEMTNPGEYELAEVVQSYERRLQEQVMLAKIDIINALEYQIQMLVTNSDEDAEWPSELLQLRSKFTEHYEKKILEMSAEHEKEIGKLKEEHMKNLNRALKRRSLNDNSFIQEDLDILQERDNLRKCTSILRIVVTHLIKYFSECEDELNNSLLEEILKRNLQSNKVIDSDEKLSLDLSNSCSKRVHITPNVTEILAAIDDSLPLVDVNIKELSVDLENELTECLGKLKDEANDILALTTSINTNKNKNTIVNERISSLTRQLLAENNIKGDLIEKLKETENYVRSLENERNNLDSHIEQLLEKQRILENDLMYAKEKIAQMMDKEVVSEGYGERDDYSVSNFDEEIVSFNELQEKARNELAEESHNYNDLIKLIEDLCRAGEKLKIEAQKEHIDLKQQIEAADKKIRATAQFLEEQASEREQERDEALKEIILLKDLLKERERDKSNCEQINKEVEHLEHQMREMSKLMEENESRTKEIELEKQEAIDKICVLRDIIRDLEIQIEAKTSTEEELKQLVRQLQQIIEQQNKSNEDLHQQLNSMQNVEHIQEHVEKLENEMQNLRLNTELIGKEGLLHQIKTELTDLEINLEKRTCDLEALHAAVSGTSCSSPSEDMSIRDQIRPRAPSVTLDECHIPLQQLARLKEKLLVHSRAEDAAMKKIRDLEMQLEHVKHELEESQNEKDILQDQVSQQLILISNLQMRLDEQRLRTEQVQKQTNTSLEVRIYDLENDIQTLKETIQNRDKTIKHLTNGIEQTKQRLEDREKELLAKVEDVTYVEQQKQIEKLQEENELLKVRINCDAKNAQILPGLVDNIIADKNKDIEILRSKLNDTQKELESFLSLNLDIEQLKSLSSMKSFERSASDLSMNKEPEQVRKAEEIIENITAENLPKPIFKRNNNETVIYFSHEDSKPKISEFDADISEIENIGRSHVNYTSEDMSLMQSHSTQIPQLTEKKRVHFSDSEDHSELPQLKKEISLRDKTIKEYTERLKILNDLEANVGDLQAKLELTENLLKQATNNFELETKCFSEIENDLRCKLHQNEKELMEKSKELTLLSEDSKRKDEMYLCLAEEKRNLEKKLDDVQSQIEHYKTLREIVEKQNKHIEDLEAKLIQTQDSVVNLKNQVVSTQKERDKSVEELGKKSVEIEKKTEELEAFKKKLIDIRELHEKQGKEIINKEKQIHSLMEDVKESKETIEEKENEIRDIQKKILEEQKSLNIVEEKLKELQSLLIERETEIDNLNQEINRYHEENEKNKQLPDSTNDYQNLQLCREIAEKDLIIVKYSAEIDDLKYEINNLQHLIKEKEKIINQISEDSKSLHVNLETIQNKMREGGNVFDLKKRLHEEQQLNAILTEQLKSLKSQIKNSEREDMVISIEEITGQVQKQLNYSALLDSNIISALNSSDDGKPHLNDAEYFKNSLSRQKEINKQLQREKEQLQEKLSTLEENYQLKKNAFDRLEFLLEKERREFNCMQLENAGILEQMRVQLETALKNEMEFEELLQKERVTHKETENQLSMLKARLTTSNTSDNSKTELTEYKSLPTAQYPELIMLRNSLESLEKENQMLKIDLKTMKKERSETMSNLKYLKEMLQFKNNELEKMEQRVYEIKKNHEQLENDYFQTKETLKQRNTEIENSRILINELEDDGRVMKKQIEELREKLQVAGELKVVPDKFLKKINELKHLVKQQVKDNNLMSETLSKLTNERQKLQLRVNELEACSNMPFTDIAARANHLFARYLKSESNKKALVWQKRYLISLLATYQDFRLTTTALPSSIFDKKSNNKSGQRSVKRFKILAISIIVVIRMQYLVRRWQSGKRFGAHLPSSYKYDTNAFNNLPANFRIGRSESRDQINSSGFKFQQSNSNKEAQIIRTQSIEDSVPGSPGIDAWFAVTPSVGKENLDTDHVTGSGFCPGSPHLLLTQYLERFDQIQKRLGIAAENNGI